MKRKSPIQPPCYLTRLLTLWLLQRHYSQLSLEAGFRNGRVSLVLWCVVCAAHHPRSGVGPNRLLSRAWELRRHHLHLAQRGARRLCVALSAGAVQTLELGTVPPRREGCQETNMG